MSTSRSRRTRGRSGPRRHGQPLPPLHSRREVVTAVLGAVAVVAGTILLVWLLRPGTTGVPGTGGLASRQPRATWLVVLTVLALVVLTWWTVRRQRRWREKVVVLMVGGWVLVLAAAAVAGVLWPGGLLRHTPEAPEPLDLSGIEDLVTTTLPGATTAPAEVPPTTGAGTAGTTTPSTTGSP